MTAHPILRAVPMLMVQELTRSIAFYHLLGFSARRYQNGDGYAFLTCDDFELHLNQSDMLVEGHNPAMASTSISPRAPPPALEAEFRAAGAPIISPLSPREWKMNEVRSRRPRRQPPTLRRRDFGA